MTERNRHLVVLSRVALIVAIGDWVTKAAAARMVAGGDLVFTERLRFAVVHNDGAAFGLTAGAYTWQLNLALTLAAIAFMIPVSRDLARIDAAAPRALGLIVGGALGNLASLVFSPAGVVDFISIGVGTSSELVLNVADVAAYIGLAMVMRTAFLIVAELRKAARPRRQAVMEASLPQVWAAVVEREVPLPVQLADRPPAADAPVARPESVRRVDLREQELADPKVIDIRPRLAQQRSTHVAPPVDAARPLDDR